MSETNRGVGSQPYTVLKVYWTSDGWGETPLLYHCMFRSGCVIFTFEREKINLYPTKCENPFMMDYHNRCISVGEDYGTR